MTPEGSGRRSARSQLAIRKPTEAIAVMKQPDIRPPFAALGMEPVGEGPEEFAKAAAGLKPK
jgi:hypothetical protein